MVSQDGLALLGRNWLSHVVLDWKAILAVYAMKSSGLEMLFVTYVDMFKDKLGTTVIVDDHGEMQPMEVKLHVRPQARSKLRQAFSLPFAKRDY